MVEEYCWAMAQAAIAVVLKPIRFQCVGFWAFGFELDCLECTLHVYAMFTVCVYIYISRKNFDLRQTFWSVPIALSRDGFGLRNAGVMLTLLLP